MGDEIQKRPRGRPHEPIVGPDQIERISELLAEGVSMHRIAREIGVDYHTIRYHIERSITPILREPTLRKPEHLLNKYEHLFTVCWEHFRAETPCETKEQLEAVVDDEGEVIPDKFKKQVTKTFKPGQVGWLQLAFSVLQEISRLLRYTTAGNQVNILNTATIQGEFRRAGANWSQLDSEFGEYLAKLIEDQREYDEAAARMSGGTILDAEP